jgi:hypothetical protein
MNTLANTFLLLAAGLISAYNVRIYWGFRG